MLVGAAVIVTSGALGDVFGRRRVFIAGLALFVASCVLIALSSGGGRRRRPDDPGRGRLDDPRVRHEPAVGERLGAAPDAGDHVVGRGSAAGAAAGPLVGGVLVDRPAGKDCSGSTPRSPPSASRSRSGPCRSRATRTARSSIDFVGTILVAVILVPLVLALSEGGDWGWRRRGHDRVPRDLGRRGDRLREGRAAGRGPARRPRASAQPRPRRFHAGDPHRRRHHQRADVRPEPVLPGPGRRSG